jgi:hypothetical protein
MTIGAAVDVFIFNGSIDQAQSGGAAFIARFHGLFHIGSDLFAQVHLVLIRSGCFIKYWLSIAV